MNKPMKFNLPEGYTQKQLLGALKEHYAVKSERPTLKRIAIYDTFDWRLFNKSLVLYESGKSLFLRKLFGDENTHRSEISSTPVYVWDFPDGQLKDKLAPILKMRALSKLVEVFCRSTSYRILNPYQKTVARLVHEKIHSNRGTDSMVLAAYVWLHPVKGYPRYSRTLSKRFIASGFLRHEKEDFYFRALTVVNQRPGSYSSKLTLSLDPDMHSDEATKIILRHLLRVMKINQFHIEKGLDTEFLHDYRVAIRRTRSALSQIKKVFPQQMTARFKKAFSSLGKLSNPLRDLDVYLLNEDAYKLMLPTVLRDDINPLFDHLRKNRATALKQVLSSFESAGYRQSLKDWETFLNDPRRGSSTAPNADLSILHLAQERIYKQYRATIKSGTKIIGNIEDEKLHALRIECKKLRYLMEFFTSLFPRRKINLLIKQLKKLQDHLGDLNDFAVQEAYLLNIAGELPVASRKHKKVLVAIGGLIGALDGKKRAVRKMFAKTFTAYASPQNKRLFGELFASQKKEDVL